MNSEHLARLRNGGSGWNDWRRANPDVHPDLREADLSGADLAGTNLDTADLIDANLSGANLYGANLVGANLYRARLDGATLVEAMLDSANLNGASLREAILDLAQFQRAYMAGADLRRASLRNAILVDADLGKSPYHPEAATLEGADLSGANLTTSNLKGANLQGAELSWANLFRSDLSEADLRGANLSGADLQLATFIGTNLEGANLTGCYVHGVSAWGVRLDNATQHNLIITAFEEATITVDNLEIAQFLYLLLNNRKIREVVDTITSKVVLILGRFTRARKAILDALRDELRRKNYLPVLFDFDVPASRDITETVSTIAHMSRFVIADITDARSIPQELMAIVPNLPSVPVQPLLLASQEEYGMFSFFRRFPWVLEPFLYDDEAALLAALAARVIAPAEAKAKEQIATARTG